MSAEAAAAAVAAATACTHFDTPEGRWVLVSEFTTEDAANQFAPQLAPKLGGDDLCAGEGNSTGSGSPAPPTPASPAVAKFGGASAIMASGGIMFGDVQPTAGNNSNINNNISNNNISNNINSTNGNSAARAPPVAKTPAHMVANRPTFVTAFHSPAHGATGSAAAAAAAAAAAESNETSRSAAQTSDASGSAGSRGHGFCQGLLGLKAAAGSGPGQLAGGRGIVSKSTSAFVSRIITSENLARWIMGDGGQAAYVLFNAPRSMVLVGMQQSQHQAHQAHLGGEETLARLDLAANTPLCYDVNHSTRSESRLDTVMGFVQGNMVWYDAISGKYARLNKNSGYTPAIMCVKWLPGSDSLFLAGTADGGVMIMDCTKDEFTLPPLPTAAAAAAGTVPARMDAFVTACPQRPRSNPVVYWKLSSRAITSIAFSPDGRHVAVTGEDGGLRIIDYLAEELEDVYLSYFGGLSCCAWSDDGKYVVAGGKDDLVSVWSYYDQCIVARCQGHESWVTGIVFDPCGHEDEDTYRFVSVGDDARLLVWDFSLPALHRPRAARPSSPDASGRAHQPQQPQAQPRFQSPSSAALHLCGQPRTGDAPSEIIHSRMPQGSVAVLQPLVSEAIHAAPLTSLCFTRDLLVTACRRGTVKVWRRPAPFDLAAYL
ncbi:hypothetical protein H4R18_001933 [Coemansia javaensis]|uniref:WD40 repeat-like protein n=1 Tax=Coemansia javaensis TaxID=2761396 RepID=A0A9W8HGK6_9FUNG|nr:hypothetical protein H4R18_001933 [Coemansia javaensis]